MILTQYVKRSGVVNGPVHLIVSRLTRVHFPIHFFRYVQRELDER